MNIQVGLVDGQGSDAFDLGDPRLGAPKEPVPTFMTMRLEAPPPLEPRAAGTLDPGRGGRGGRGGGGRGQYGSATLQVIENYHGGSGTVRYRRALYPALFTTNWAYVDHLVLSPGAVDGLHRHPHVGEVYYVINGSGEVRVNNETAPIAKGDGIPVRPDERHSLRNTGKEDLELMIIGISTVKGMVDTVEGN
jgi:mannose-6-phosphate isomerase-like protein (cupin superfamily)